MATMTLVLIRLCAFLPIIAVTPAAISNSDSQSYVEWNHGSIIDHQHAVPPADLASTPASDSETYAEWLRSETIDHRYAGQNMDHRRYFSDHRRSGSGSGSGSGAPTSAPTSAPTIAIERSIVVIAAKVSFSQELTAAQQETAKAKYKSQLEIWYITIGLVFEVSMEPVTTRRSYSYALSGTASVAASAAAIVSQITTAAPSPGARSLSAEISQALSSAFVTEGISNSVGPITVSQTTFGPTGAPTSGATDYAEDSERSMVVFILCGCLGVLSIIFIVVGCACHSNKEINVPRVNFTDDTTSMDYGCKCDPNAVGFDPNSYATDPTASANSGVRWDRNPASGMLMGGTTHFNRNVVTGEMKAIGDYNSGGMKSEGRQQALEMKALPGVGIPALSRTGSRL